jgi:hypothetical protein
LMLVALLSSRMAPTTTRSPQTSGRRYPWAELLKRVFAVDVLRCDRCGGRREVLALITEGAVVRAILKCLGLPADAPMIHPSGARAAGAVLSRGDRRGSAS